MYQKFFEKLYAFRHLIPMLPPSKERPGKNNFRTMSLAVSVLEKHEPEFQKLKSMINALSPHLSIAKKYALKQIYKYFSDILEKNITLPKQKVGNLLIIKDTGAYGKVMASNYNSRGLPIEILVNNNIFQKIYQPLTSKEFINQDIIPEWLD